MEETKTYNIKPTYKKSVCETQIWFNSLNDKKITIKVNNVYRWGNFTIELTEKQKEEILEKDYILLNDYDYELEEMWDGGCDFWIDIENEKDYSKEELEEINQLIYHWKGPIPEYEDEDDYGYSYEKLESNGWFEDDCEITLSSKCNLTEIKS